MCDWIQLIDWERRKGRDPKRELYFSDPRCLEVWEVSQSLEIVTCYRHGESKVYTAGDLIPIPKLIGFGLIPVQSIYDGIV